MAETTMYYGKYHDFVVPIMLGFSHLFPRTVWAFAEYGFGIDKHNKMSYFQLPVLARNDMGGTGKTNMLHYMQNILTGGF